MKRNLILKHVFEGNIKGMRRWRRHKRLLGDLKEKRWYWKLKEEALDRTLWKTHSGRGYEPATQDRVHNEWPYTIANVNLQRTCHMLWLLEHCFSDRYTYCKQWYIFT